MISNIRKIAVVIPKYGLVGGAERFAYELSERLSLNKKYGLHVFANKWQSNSDRITFHKVPIIKFPRFLTTISFAWFANRKIAKMNFDLIHTHDRIFDADIFTMHGIPHRIWVHEVRMKFMSLFDRATCWVEKRLVNNTRYKIFLPVSNLTKEKFLQEYKIEPEKTQVIHPGVDIDRFHRLDREHCRKEIRKQFKIDPSDIVILFVSMNFKIKGLDYVMAAVGKAKASYPSRKIRLLVVGKGDYKKYGALAQQTGIKDNVIFAGIQKENLEKIYLASDIFMMLSRFDTFGITVLEAMAASLPVIISNKVGAKDLLREGINGFIIEDTTNTDMICDKIGFMLDSEIRSTMAKKAYNTALNNSWDTVAKRVEGIYEEMLQT
ncbi:MAG: glycosyltransferase family 4 protein [Desulfobacterales bacterium]|uniref:Glycosyltransferase family 4 protein n=1 Tax=Candidatus Desulfaltia bathyphila TaxID=2841697 RepID=A0A8J6T7E1_9BACT|nr:glycosyltransferase family 4 protein [Candidatus Desulfaltia bathyphila]MBL7196215.1 glycosyltransferase family 4 protein [Desulfobacterales bacterium]MBL7208245.1 glycosyltransferase family 4 protein [Desulfobacterales bacterium]